MLNGSRVQVTDAVPSGQVRGILKDNGMDGTRPDKSPGQEIISFITLSPF